MNPRVNLPSIGVDVLVKTPKAFIFMVCRLAKGKGDSKFSYVDFLLFLGTNYWEVKDFLETLVPPIKWLVTLSKTAKGRKILRALKLPHNPQELQYLAAQMEEGEFSSYDRSLFCSDQTDEGPSVSPEKEEDLFLDCLGNMVDEQEEIVPKSEPGGHKENKGKKPKAKEEIVADPAERFLAGAQRVTGLFSVYDFDAVFGAERIIRFRIFRIIPAEWQSLLLEFAGGSELLDRFSKILKLAPKKNEAFSENKRDVPKKEAEKIQIPVVLSGNGSQEKISQKKGENVEIKNIPIAEVSRILNAIRQAAGLIDDSPIAAILGMKPGGIINMRKGKERLNTGHLSLIARKINIQPKVLEGWI